MVLTVCNFLFTTGLCVIQFTSALLVDKTSTGLTGVPQDINVLVTDLKLDSNYITRITNSSFVLYPELRILRLKNNGLTHIEDGSFDHNGKLEQLLAMTKSMIQLPHSFGSAALSLRIIQFWCAVRNEAFSTANFSEMIRLEWLNMGCVNFYGTFDASVLPRNLEYIGLNLAGLSQFPDLVRYTPKAVTIGLSRNTITEIPREQLVGNLALQKLYLQQNKISTIPDMYHLPLTDLYLDRNPLVCDSALCWIRMWPWMKTPLTTDDITCDTPVNLQHALRMDINPITLACQTGGSNWKSTDKIIYRLKTG